MNEEIPLSPIAGWDIAYIAAYQAVMIRLHYLTHATQHPDQAQMSPHFVVNAPQCRELIEALERALARLREGPQEGTGLPQH